MTPFMMLILAGYAVFMLALGYISLRALADGAAERKTSGAKRAAHPGAQHLAE